MRRRERRNRNMQQLKTMIEGFVNKNVLPLGVTAIFVVIVIMGFAFLAPGHKAKEWAKEHVLCLIIGAALIYTGSSWATDIAASFGF